MTKAFPTPPFAGVDLQIQEVPPGERFGRIFLSRYPDPLGFGKTPSRFSDQRRRIPASRFGVLYLGQTLKVCFLEAVLRDQRDGVIGDLPIDEAELHNRSYAQIEVVDTLRMVDLREDRAIVMGVPSDVAKASNQTLARRWSLAFHGHPAEPDGIMYPSRLNGHTNLAVFDRAVPKLQVVAQMELIAAPGLAVVLNDLRVGVIAD
jgi:hypothetical protein